MSRPSKIRGMEVTSILDISGGKIAKETGDMNVTEMTEQAGARNKRRQLY